MKTVSTLIALTLILGLLALSQGAKKMLQTPEARAPLTEVTLREIHIDVFSQTAWVSYAFLDGAGNAIRTTPLSITAADYPAFLAASGVDESTLFAWVVNKAGLKVQ